MSEYTTYQQEENPQVPQALLPQQPSPIKKKDPLHIASVLLSAAALIVSLAALLRTFPPPADVSQPETDTAVFAQADTVITYKDRQLPAFTQVPLNQYDLSCFTFENGQISYTAEGRQALVGVDVSFYQKDIDWNQVKASGVDFAMIRVGYRGYRNGAIMPDSYCEQNIMGALKAGLKVGMYFFSQAITVEEAQEEASFVLNAIRGYDITFPVVFDWETITNSNSAHTKGLSSRMLTACAQAFCRRIAQEGYTPGIYFNQDLGYLGYDLDKLADYPFWLADYDRTPSFYYHFDMWQYTAKGTVPGIEGDVDMNLCFTTPV